MYLCIHKDDALLYDQKLVKNLIYPFLRKELILPSQEKQFKKKEYSEETLNDSV